MIGHVQGMQPNFGQLGERSPLSKNVTEILHPYLGNNWPCPRSVIKFWSSQWTITFIQKVLAKFWSVYGQVVTKIQSH
jgi:hypothetical protein